MRYLCKLIIYSWVSHCLQPLSTLSIQQVSVSARLIEVRHQNISMGEVKEKLSLKLLVDTRANKVLFAEAGKDFVDLLFHILSLPIGTIVKLVGVNDMVGCLGDLYKSIEALNTHYMQSNVTKDLVLQPTAVPLPALLKDSWNSTDTSARKVYTCSSSTYHSPRYHSDKSGGRCPGCGASMTTELLYADSNSSNSVSNSNLASSSGGFVKGVVTYISPLSPPFLLLPSSTRSTLRMSLA